MPFDRDSPSRIDVASIAATTGKPTEAEVQTSIPVLIPSLPTTDALVPYLRRIDASNWYSNYGPLWREFRHALEARLTFQTGTGAHIAFTANGTTAIELGLRCRALPDRRYCLMPSYTFIASAHAVCNAGLIPYLTDVCPQSLTLTPEIAEDALKAIPEPPAAILVVSAFGAPPDVAAWETFERTCRIPIVFDAAAAAASLDSIGHQPLAVSLHATKVLGIGEGGAVVSSDPDLVGRITAMTGFGFAGNGRVSMARGGNYRISEYTAAVGLAALAELDHKIARLRTVVARYRKNLANSPIRLQDGVGECWNTMTLNVTIPRDTLEETLRRLDYAGVQWRRWWGLGCHAHPAFEAVPALILSVTRDLAPRVIGVPCHTRLTPEQIDIICTSLLKTCPP